ncbi:RING/U-box superfamily protein, partial [Striga hermonthica]
EGFRFRLENIVRGQVSSQPDTSLNGDNNESIRDQRNTNVSDRLQHGHQHINVQLLNRMENIDRSAQSTDQNVASDAGNQWREQGSENERVTQQQSAQSDLNRWRHDTSGGVAQNRPENAMSDWPSAVVAEDGRQHHIEEAHGVWNIDASTEAVNTWSEGPSDPPRTRRSFPLRRVARFHLPEDDNVYSMELRELLSSRIAKIGLYQIFSSRDKVSYSVIKCIIGDTEQEWETMNDLRADVVKLQQGMSHMQRMLEACMDMQLELQRSVRQEVSAALNRSSDGE